MSLDSDQQSTTPLTPPTTSSGRDWFFPSHSSHLPRTPLRRFSSPYPKLASPTTSAPPSTASFHTGTVTSSSSTSSLSLGDHLSDSRNYDGLRRRFDHSFPRRRQRRRNERPWSRDEQVDAITIASPDVSRELKNPNDAIPVDNMNFLKKWWTGVRVCRLNLRWRMVFCIAVSVYIGNGILVFGAQ